MNVTDKESGILQGSCSCLCEHRYYGCVCVRACEGSKNEERQQEMGVRVVVYSGSHARREEPPIRLTAGGLSLGKKTQGFWHSDCRSEALVHSLFCVIARRVTCRRARPSDRSASQVLPCVFPPRTTRPSSTPERTTLCMPF